MDVNSLCGEFHYVCGKEQGFRILEEEILERLGIAGLDVGDCGVVSGCLKEKASSPFDILVEEEQNIDVDENAYEDDGMILKRLKGLGEMSATGMYEEKGILVKAISPESRWRKRGLRERDVILSVNGRETDDPKETVRLLSEEAGNVKVWREQGLQILQWQGR